MDTTTPVAPDRERTAERLLRSSEANSFDPAVDVDWAAPLAPDRYFTPPRRSSLYGTALWAGLSEAQRIELTRHEVASIASVGIWFELILMQMLLRDCYDRDPLTAHSRYALTEIGDECRHSVMFARMIDRLGVPAYGPGRRAQALGRIFKSTSTGTLTYAATMYVEEILDTLQRESTADENVQPLVRRVSQIHVVEEARHISFAREEVRRRWRTKRRWRRSYERLMLGLVVYVATTRLIHPAVYAAVGLDPAQAVRVARANPHWQRTRRQCAAKVAGVLGELGMIGDGPGRWLWRRAGALA